MKKKGIRHLITALCLTALLTGCSAGTALSMEPVQANLDTIAIPEQVQVVGLGEASHGVRQYQELKAEVFQILVRDYGCRTFIIEGDFGNALKVDTYIHGGEGTAKDAAAMIGFRIYRTEEMEKLLDWMRTYNETAPAGEDLHFYGMDMQQADSSKEYLFHILETVKPELAAEYSDSLAFLNDDDMYDISADAFTEGMSIAAQLTEEVDHAKEQIEETFDGETFLFARECACSLYNCCDIRKSDADYNNVRDGYMAEKVHWFLEHGDGSILFINGHNGHIGKTNVAAYDCLGKRLAEDLGEQYFAIGTDARTTTFNSQTDDGFEKLTVKNKNDLNALAGEVDSGHYYIDLENAAADDGWQKLLSDTTRITCLNVGSLTFLKMFYTTNIVPADTFDGMIVFDQVEPTTIS